MLKRLIVSVVLVIFIMNMSSCSCSNSTSKIESATESKYLTTFRIFDYDSQKLVFQMGAKDDDVTITLFNLMTTTTTEDVITTEPSYIINVVDNSGAQQDEWANIYIQNEQLYIQFIPEKMPVAEKLNITDEIRKSDVTAKEFLNIIES